MVCERLFARGRKLLLDSPSSQWKQRSNSHLLTWPVPKRRAAHRSGSPLEPLQQPGACSRFHKRWHPATVLDSCKAIVLSDKVAGTLRACDSFAGAIVTRSVSEGNCGRIPRSRFLKLRVLGPEGRHSPSRWREPPVTDRVQMRGLEGRHRTALCRPSGP